MEFIVDVQHHHILYINCGAAYERCGEYQSALSVGIFIYISCVYVLHFYILHIVIIVFTKFVIRNLVHIIYRCMKKHYY